MPRTDADLAWRVARDTWRGLTALTDRENGLPVDNVYFDGTSPATDARVGDYTSASDIGLHLIAIVAAHDLHLISSGEAITKIRRILDTLEQLETYRGFFFNFYDTTSLERTSNFISFVDSSWLTAGLMVVRMSFPELYEPCTKLIAQTDYGFFYDGRTQRISPRLLHQARGALAIRLRHAVHRGAAGDVDRHRQGRRAGGPVVRDAADLSRRVSRGSRRRPKRSGSRR